MDKNAMTGMLLMAAIIFGFLYFKTPKENTQKQAQTEQTQAASSTEDKPQLFADSLSESEIANLRQAIINYGVTEGSSNVRVLRNGALDLRLDSLNRISGDVEVGGKKVDMAELRNGSMVSDTKIQALKELRQSLTTLYKYSEFASHLTGDVKEFTLENDLMSVTLSTQGGMPRRAILKKYKVETDNRQGDVMLFDAATDTMGFTLPSLKQIYNTNEFVFNGEQVNDSTVMMKMNFGGDRSWGIRYTLHSQDYLLTMDVVQNGMEEILGSALSSIGFNWHQKMLRNEEGRTFEQRNSGIYYKYVNDSPDNLSENSDDHKSINQDIRWVAFKNQFFSSVVISRNAFTSAELRSWALNNNPAFVKQMDMSARVPYNIMSAEPLSFDFYFGPNDFPLLNRLEDEVIEGENLKLTKLIPLGWGLFGWINRYLIIPIFDFLGSFNWNYGIIILVLTIIVKIILFPFTYKSYISQAKMRVLAPEIKEINDKYPGQENAMTRQQKTMALYSRAGASPMSGCLPLLLQMPILIAMFAFFPSCIELRGESFLWAKDLSAPDFICALPFSIPWYGDHVSLFCLLMTATNIIYTRINMQNQPTSASMPGMKWMMYLMPVMFLFFFNDYASGLSYYYFLSLLITIVQTYVCRKMIDEKKVRAQMLANAQKPKKKSGFMARLEEAQRKQQAMLREQQKQQGKGRR